MISAQLACPGLVFPCLLQGERGGVKGKGGVAPLHTLPGDGRVSREVLVQDCQVAKQHRSHNGYHRDA